MSLDRDYLELVLEINRDLRSQLEVLYKLLRTKIKVEVREEGGRLENVLNELEILKTSLSFNMQKQVNVVKHIKSAKSESSEEQKERFSKLVKEKEDTIADLESKVDALLKENMFLNERNLDYTHELELLKRENETNRSLHSRLKEKEHQFEEEKNKNRNLVNLIKELEKRKLNTEDTKEYKLEIEFLKSKLEELDLKYRKKIEKKDLIIKNLDQSLVEYEEKLNSFVN